MKRLFPIIPIALLAVFAASSGDLAYLSLDEVFTDLEIPEEQPAEAAPAEEQNPFEAEEPAAAAEEEETPPPPPLFYRSGEEIKTVTEPVPPTPQEPENIFEEPEMPTEATPGETIAPEEPAVAPTEEPVTEEIAPEEKSAEEGQAETKASAPRQSFLMKLVNRLKYLVAAIGLGIGAGVYMFGKKKVRAPKSAAAAAAAEQPPQGAQAPQTAAVEETSKRLEHALNAIEDTKEGPAAAAPETAAPPVEGNK